VILLPYLATVAIMLAVAWLLRRGCRNAARPFDARPRGPLGRVLAEHDAAERDRLSRLAASHRYTRADEERFAAEERLGHQNYAWPPHGQIPPPRPSRYCRCVWFQDGTWSPCRIHDSGLTEAHISQWEEELSE
jgi:hypothetical protein